MALFQENDDDRTESATPFRREEFRRRGSVAVSKDAAGLVVLFCVLGSFWISISGFQVAFQELSHSFFEKFPKDLSFQEVIDLWKPILYPAAKATFPIIASALLGGLAISLVQVGFFLTWEPLEPKWERINPITGFNRLFSWSHAMEGIKALFKYGIAIWVCYAFVKSHMHVIFVIMQEPVATGFGHSLHVMGTLFLYLLMACSVVGFADYGFQRYRLEQEMKMTKREAKEEFKLREGDPKIKARIRSIQRKIASRRMMDAVPKADVIITNPTHLSIALQYDQSKMRSPRVVAKGAGHIAMKIREIARIHQIPMVENKPLARTLYKEIEIGKFVPKELYKAVAEVLAYVYRLRTKRLQQVSGFNAATA